jgi:hypothetical protein
MKRKKKLKVDADKFLASPTLYGVQLVGTNKTFNRMNNIGSSKYVINYHDGIKTHKDGSPFFDIAIFKNKKNVLEFTKKLIAEGYVES